MIGQIGQAVEAAEDIIRIKVPLPFPLRWVNSYLVKGRGGYTLIDPGLHTAEAEALWTETLGLLGISYTDIEKIVLTHHHPDHLGLAGWFQERSGARVWISEAGFAQAKKLWGEGQPLTADIYRLFLRHGLHGEREAQIVPHLDGFVPLVAPLPQQVSFIKPGDRFMLGDRDCETVHTPGHAFGHICFYEADRREMFCGDHVLPQISPNISYIPGVDENPLASYLRSLEEAAGYTVSVAYPGHREPFSTWDNRIAELLRHHRERLDTMEGLLLQPHTGYELCLAVFGERLTIHQLRFALSETLAHVIYLREAGRVREEERDGTIFFAAT